jgi:type IV pilus assembly protein PilX
MRIATPRREHGMVLAVMLLILLMIAILGAAVMRSQVSQQRISSNWSNRSVAAANAEATLRWGECGLEGGCGGAAWTPSAFLANQAGLYTLDTDVGTSVTASSPNVGSGATWEAPAGTTLAYGGPALQTPNAPQYVIEKLPPVMLPGDSISQQQYAGNGTAAPYQITTFANGGDNTSRAVLQSVFRP